jgi:spermidine synthase
VTRPRGDGSGAVVRALGLTLIALLLASHELVVRQSRAYLSPLGQMEAALASAAVGALLGAVLGAKANRPRVLAPLSLLALAMFCALSGFAYLAAFERPAAWTPVRLAVPFFGSALVSAAAASTTRAFAHAARELDVVVRLLRPAVLATGLALLLLGAALVTQLGLERSAPLLGLLLSFLAYQVDKALSFVWGDRQRGMLARGFASLVVALGCAGALAPSAPQADHGALGHASTVVFASGEGRDQVVVASGQGAFAVFVGGSLRWSGLDGMRYASALVEPAILHAPSESRCLVLGGSEGLVARRLLDSSRCSRIDVVTPEASVVSLTRSLLPLALLTRGALFDPHVNVIDAEPLVWLAARQALGDTTHYDVVVVDLPDPTDAVSGKNYTQYFYELLRDAASGTGVITLQAAPPLRAPRVFSNVLSTVEAAGLRATPYEAELPALGLWGFLLATPDANPEKTIASSAHVDALDARLPLRPASRDVPVTRDAPTRLSDLRVVHLALAGAREHD